MLSVWGLSKGSQSVFTQVLEKTTESSEQLGRQERLEIECGISHLPVLSTEPLLHWWGRPQLGRLIHIILNAFHFLAINAVTMFFNLKKL